MSTSCAWEMTISYRSGEDSPAVFFMMLIFHIRIKWQPVVLSFTFPSRATKGGKDPLIPIRSRLEDLDIKTVIPYVVGKTTHVVAGKRNTAKCLQALINGVHIVNDSFMDAIVYATTPGNLDEPESLSPLEEDFDKHWPKAAEYLPPPSKEPGQRPAELFAPDPKRQNIFDGYTFVFGDQRQFESLQPPITNGGGKALFFEIQHSKTTAIEIVKYLKKVAGEEGLGAFHDGSRGRGVVFVRLLESNTFDEWTMKVQEEVILLTRQRLVEQNEFLDAILTNSASQLRRPITVRELHEASNRTQGSGESSLLKPRS